MKTYKGKIDNNDLNYVIERFGFPVAARPCPIQDDKINPHVSRFLLKDGQIADVFHIKPVYYEALNGEWHPLDEVTYGFGNHWAYLKEDWDKKMSLRFLRWWMRRMELIEGGISYPFPKIGLKKIREGVEINLTTTTFFPDPDPTTTSVDGKVERIANDTFANLRTGAGTGFRTNQGVENISVINATTVTDQYSGIIRFIHLYDTSAIGAGKTISAATASMYSADNISNQLGGSHGISLVNSTPASNTVLANADYGNVGTTQEGADLAIASIVDAAYNDFILNATGKAAISLTGVTKFAYTLDFDRTNTAPTWVSSQSVSWNGQSADTAGTTQDPKLVVTYSTPALKEFMLMGVGI